MKTHILLAILQTPVDSTHNLPQIILDGGAGNLIYMKGEVFGVAAILTGVFAITGLGKDRSSLKHRTSAYPNRVSCSARSILSQLHFEGGLLC